MKQNHLEKLVALLLDRKYIISNTRDLFLCFQELVTDSFSEAKQSRSLRFKAVEFNKIFCPNICPSFGSSSCIFPSEFPLKFCVHFSSPLCAASSNFVSLDSVLRLYFLKYLIYIHEHIFKVIFQFYCLEYRFIYVFFSVLKSPLGLSRKRNFLIQYSCSHVTMCRIAVNTSCKIESLSSLCSRRSFSAIRRLIHR